jgi:hypothetical protein
VAIHTISNSWLPILLVTYQNALGLTIHIARIALTFDDLQK